MFPFQTESSCSQDISSYIQTLPANTNCGISSGCMAIQCCTDLALIGRTLNYSVNIDVCEHSLSLQIETFQFQLSLVDFQFGDEHVFGIDQIFSLRFLLFFSFIFHMIMCGFFNIIHAFCISRLILLISNYWVSRSKKIDDYVMAMKKILRFQKSLCFEWTFLCTIYSLFFIKMIKEKCICQEL